MSLKSTIEKNERIYQLENARRRSVDTLETFLSRYDEKLTGGELAQIHGTIDIGREALK